jgi:lysophospholipase L1-like esterase
MRPLAVLAAAGFALALAWGGWAQAPARHWVGTWAAAPQPSEGPRSELDNQTVRMMVRVSIGGSQLRLRFSNRFGRQADTLGDVRVALAGAGSSIVPGSGRQVTFSGQDSFTLPPGSEALSDPVALAVPALTRLAVSVYAPVFTGAATWHALADERGYIAGHGDFAAAAAFPPDAEMTTHWFWLDGIDVAAPPSARAAVAFGDSITDGYQSTVGADRRWPDVMAQVLDAPGRGGDVGVLNEGISGNRILHDQAGPSALARFGRDVLAQNGVTAVILLEGINDIGWPDEKGGRYAAQAVTAANIIAGLRQMIARAHARGLRVFGCTLTPYLGADYYSPAGEAKREAVNRWIRSSGAFDGVIDFARLTRDPADPKRLLPAYDSGDHLHPNDAGYAAMGKAAAAALLAVSGS